MKKGDVKKTSTRNDGKATPARKRPLKDDEKRVDEGTPTKVKKKSAKMQDVDIKKSKKRKGGGNEVGPKTEKGKKVKAGKENVKEGESKKGPKLIPSVQNKKDDREKQKKRKEERQKKAKSEDVYTLGVEVKKMWESLRREDCDPGERSRLTEELHKEVRGKLMKLLFAHDTVRPLECLVALGSERIRDELFAEVRECLVSVAKAPYGHFFLAKLLKYGSKEQRAAIFKTFQGRVADLTKHKVANNIVESLYNEYANAKQRNHMLQEFCGPEFRAFKEDDLRTVAQLIERHPVKEKDIVRHLGNNVNTLIHKGCYNHSLVHTVIYNYLQVRL